MLGLVLAAFNTIAKGVATIYIDNDNNNSKRDALKRNPNAKTYIDYEGRTKLISNNHPTLTKTLPDGDVVLIDTKTWKQVENISQTNRNLQRAGLTKQQIEWKNKAIENGKRFCTFEVQKGSLPTIYKDLQTGELCYHKRHMNVYYYSDLKGNFIEFDNFHYEMINKYGQKYLDSHKEDINRIMNDPTAGIAI